MNLMSAAENVLNSIGGTRSSVYMMKTEEAGDYYYVSFFQDCLFYEAYVEKETGSVSGLSFEPGLICVQYS